MASLSSLWNEKGATQCLGKQPLQHQGSALLILPDAMGVEPKASSKPGKFYALSPPFCLYSKTASLSCHIDLEPAIFLSGSPDYLGQQSYTTRPREGSRCTEWQGPRLLHSACRFTRHLSSLILSVPQTSPQQFCDASGQMGPASSQSPIPKKKTRQWLFLFVWEATCICVCTFICTWMCSCPYSSMSVWEGTA